MQWPNIFSAKGIIWGLVAMTISLGWAVADPPAPVSSFAPLDELRGQIDYFIKALERDLANAEAYGEDQQGRVEKNAATLVVLGQALGQHDRPHVLRQAAPRIVEAAQEVYDEAYDHESAQAAFENLRAAMEDPTDEPEAGNTTDYEPVADIVTLMQQVPILNNQLRRIVTGRRFKRSLDRSAGLATTLATIAHVTAHDISYCGDEESELLWRNISWEMRDAGTAAQQAIREADQAAADRALQRMVETCDACHHTFRD